MVFDGYVKYEEAEVHRSAIIKDMRKKKINGRLAAILAFISAKFVMGYPCVRHYILFCSHGPELRKYHKIIQIQNGH